MEVAVRVVLRGRWVRSLPIVVTNRDFWRELDSIAVDRVCGEDVALARHR